MGEHPCQTDVHQELLRNLNCQIDQISNIYVWIMNLKVTSLLIASVCLCVWYLLRRAISSWEEQLGNAEVEGSK